MVAMNLNLKLEGTKEGRRTDTLMWWRLGVIGCQAQSKQASVEALAEEAGCESITASHHFAWDRCNRALAKQSSAGRHQPEMTPAPCFQPTEAGENLKPQTRLIRLACVVLIRVTRSWCQTPVQNFTIKSNPARLFGLDFRVPIVP
jgi:hypothetical protein